MVWSKSLKSFIAGMARGTNHGVGHTATTEKSWGLGMGQEAGMGLCTWLRKEHCQDVVLLGAGTPVWLLLGMLEQGASPARQQGTALLERGNKQATPKFPPC